MGRTYLFVCSRCYYRTSVSGGADQGRRFAVQTIACEDCRELFDAVIRLKSNTKPEAEEEPAPGEKSQPNPAPVFSEVLNRLLPRGPQKWLSFKPACPNSPRHRVRTWQHPDRCPKCGSPLEHNDAPFRLWD